MMRHQNDNVGVAHGNWGEAVALDYLRRTGYEIIDRNSRPVRRDRRLEIDIVAWEKRTDTMVFAEVKQHAKVSTYASRLRSVDTAKKNNLRYACNAWRRVNKWKGAYRFDVIEIYGEPDKGEPIIDHIDHVDLFARKGRFVKWI